MPPRARSAASRRVPDLPQQLQRLVRGAVVEGRLRTDVRQLCPAPYRGAAHVDLDRRALPRRGRSSTAAPGVTWSGSRLATPSDSSGGCSGVRPSGAYRVSTRSRASSSIAPPGRHPRGDVGDRVPHPEPAVAALDVHRLVQVLRALGVDGDERDVGGVDRSPSGSPAAPPPPRRSRAAGTPPARRARRAGRRDRAARARRRPPPAPPAAGGRAAGRGVGARREPRRALEPSARQSPRRPRPGDVHHPTTSQRAENAAVS